LHVQTLEGQAVSHRSLPLVPLALAALAALVAACGDDPIRPDSLAELLEADAIDRSARDLPGLGEFLSAAAGADAGQRASLIRARELWTAGLTAGGVAGADQRRLAAGLAAPALATAVPPEDWTTVRDRLEGWLVTADRMLLHLDLPAARDRLVDARLQLDRADAATSAETRVYHVVLAVSELVETTPGYLARMMVADAAVAVARAETAAARGDGNRVGPGSLARARRLVDWAARAMEEEEHMRAIQRAYYAIQLVEER